MKKYFILGVVGLLLGFSASAFAASTYGSSSEIIAPDRVNRWDLGVGVAGGFNSESDDALFVYGQASYGVTPYIGLGVEAGWEESDGDEGTIDTVGVVPVLADIIIRVPTVHESIVPYGILGLGGAGVYVERDNLDDEDDTGFAWKLGAGVDYFINANWIFNFEFAYWDADVTLDETGIDGFDWWTIGISLKYVF